MINLTIRRLLFAALFCFSTQSLADRELLVYTWPEYFDPDLIKQFERIHNVKVRELWYKDDESKDAGFFLHHRYTVDVLLSSGTTLPPYLKLKALAQLRQPATLDELEPAIQGLPVNLLPYAMPYTWGTLGIAYRKDLTSHRFESWMEFFKPDDELHGRIQLMSDVHDLYSTVAIALAYDNPDQLNEQQLDAVQALLLAQKPAVRDYEYMDPFEKAPMVTGGVSAALMYNGDALLLQEFNDQIVYQLPAEGGLLWVDYLVINANSQQIELAQAFIEFFSEAQNAAKNAQYLYYASPWVEASELMPEAFRANPVIYPTAQLLDKLHVSSPLGVQYKKAYTNKLSDLLRH
jgi:spermidine/putrescine transport system substrate-binding protein